MLRELEASVLRAQERILEPLDAEQRVMLVATHARVVQLGEPRPKAVES